MHFQKRKKVKMKNVSKIINAFHSKMTSFVHSGKLENCFNLKGRLHERFCRRKLSKVCRFGTTGLDLKEYI